MKPQSSIYSRYFTYIKPLRRLPLVKTYGTTIFTILVITIFILFAIKPTVETILVLQKRLQDSTDTLNKLQKKGEDLSLGKRNYDNLNDSVKNSINNAIPDSIQVKSIIQTLEASANNHEASISALQIQPQVLQTKADDKPGLLQEIAFTFNMEGEYANLISALNDIGTSTRLISIESLSINQISEGRGIIMSISGKGWYYK